MNESVAASAKQRWFGGSCRLLLIILLLLLSSSSSHRTTTYDASDALALGPRGEFDDANAGKQSAVVDDVSEFESNSMDALEYSEYGAELLQKTEAVQESSGKCDLEISSGDRCQVTRIDAPSLRRICSVPDQSLSGDDLAPCIEESTLGDYSCRMIASDIVGVEDGSQMAVESYIVCCCDRLSGTITCDLACCTSSHCYLTGVGSNTCYFGGSLFDAIFYDIEISQGPLPLPSSTSEAIDATQTDSENVVTSSELFLCLEGGDGCPSQTKHDEYHLIRSSQRDIEQDFPVVLLEDEKLLQISSLSEAESQQSIADGIVTSSQFENDAYVPLPASDPESAIVVDGDGTPLNQDEAGLGNEILSSTSVEQDGLQDELPRPHRVGHLIGLDEYKRAILEKQQTHNGHVDVTNLPLQTKRSVGDETYNYGASSHGAKVITSNKEAKGASHIIGSDKDKYLRNPCGAEDKHVIIELAAEAFVDTVAISNFEFHSSNLKEFEILGSVVYPTKDWILLGMFQAENVRHRQKFTLEEPKLVRYLMLKMHSHFGSEFFCTLSSVEVYGVDVIKNLLEDWIALEEQEIGVRSQQTPTIQIDNQDDLESILAGVSTLQVADSRGSGTPRGAPPIEGPPAEQLNPENSMVAGIIGANGRAESKGKAEGPARATEEDVKPSAPVDSGQDTLHVQGGRPSGESVLKILMQKVKSLELNQSMFDQYLEDTSRRYQALLNELDTDLDMVTQRLRNETALSATLARRLDEMEQYRKQEKMFLEYQLQVISNNFTDNVDFMRWQIQNMEKREVTAIVMALFCIVVSAFLYLLACCLSRKSSTLDFSVQKVDTISKDHMDYCFPPSVCNVSSHAVLYLACSLIVLILSV